MNKTAINITPAPTSSKVAPAIPANSVRTPVPSSSVAPIRNGPFLNTPVRGQANDFRTIKPEDCDVTLESISGRPPRTSDLPTTSQSLTKVPHATSQSLAKALRSHDASEVEILTPSSPKKAATVANKKRIASSAEEFTKSSTGSSDHEVVKMGVRAASLHEAVKVISAGSHKEESVKATSAGSSHHEAVKMSTSRPSHHEAAVKVINIGSPNEEIVKVVSAGSTSYKKIRHELPVTKEAKRSKMCFECQTRERNQTLGCEEGEVIISVLATSFGHPQGSCYDPQLWRSNAQCHMDVLGRIAPKCLGKSSCDVAADKEYFGSPCAGEEFRLVVNYACAHHKFVLDYEPYEPLPEKYQLNGISDHTNILSKEYEAGKGKDHLLAGIGKDHLLAGKGQDHLLAGKGQDHLLAGKGQDHLLAGKGQDHLLAGKGKDHLLGERKNGKSVHGNGTEVEGKYVVNATSTDKKYNASHLSTNGNYSRNDLARYNVSGVGILRGKSNSASSLSFCIAIFTALCMTFLQI